LIDYDLFCNKWSNNTPKAAEATAILNLIAEIAMKIITLTEGTIIITNDNKKLIKNINNELKKVNQYIQYTRTIISKIKHIMQNTTIIISLDIKKGYQTQTPTFQDDPGAYLLK